MSINKSVQEFVGDYFCELNASRIIAALVTLPQEVVIEEVKFIKKTQENSTVDGSNDNWDYFCEIEINNEEYTVYSPLC